MELSPSVSFLGMSSEDGGALPAYLGVCLQTEPRSCRAGGGGFRIVPSERLLSGEGLGLPDRGESVFACKYDSGSIVSKTPLLKSQGNAVITKLPMIGTKEHVLSKGVKKTLLEVEFDDFTLFLTHLPLGYAARSVQLGEIAERCIDAKKPVILAGDGNTYRGERELRSFFRKTGFQNANPTNTPTFPSRIPALALDFVLYGPGIEMERFDVPRVRYSDHLPLVCDFTVARPKKERHSQ